MVENDEYRKIMVLIGGVIALVSVFTLVFSLHTGHYGWAFINLVLTVIILMEINRLRKYGKR
jgi:hypothetical protein